MTVNNVVIDEINDTGETYPFDIPVKNVPAVEVMKAFGNVCKLRMEEHESRPYRK